MPTLLVNATKFTLSPASEDIGEVLNVIADKLPGLGYTGVQRAEDVHGIKGDFLLAVRYLFIGNRDFWQIVAVGGDGAVADGLAEINEVNNMISGLQFL